MADLQYQDDAYTPIGRIEAKRLVWEAADGTKAAHALVRVAFNDPEADWISGFCFEVLEEHPSSALRGLAITCLGHVARIHGRVDTDRACRLFLPLASHEAFAGTIDDALDDFGTYLGEDQRLAPIRLSIVAADLLPLIQDGSADDQRNIAVAVAVMAVRITEVSADPIGAAMDLLERCEVSDSMRERVAQLADDLDYAALEAIVPSAVATPSDLDAAEAAQARAYAARAVSGALSSDRYLGAAETAYWATRAAGTPELIRAEVQRVLRQGR